MAGELDAENSVLTRLVRLKGQCLAQLAHDARNAVAMLQGADRLASSRGDATFLRRALEKAQRQFHETARAVENLLDVSALVRGSLPMHWQSVDLTALVQRVSKTMDGQIQDKGQTLAVTVPNERLYITADPVRLERALVNVFALASHNSLPGKTVGIALSRDDQAAAVTFSSETGGLTPPPALSDYLSSMEASGERGYDTLTLGACLASVILQEHDGTLEAGEDATRLTVHLPLKPS